MARNAHPEVTRQRILDAARTLFADKGYEKTTIQDIVDTLGDLSKGAIYHHFTSKEAILDALCDADMRSGDALVRDYAQREDLTGMQMLRSLLTDILTDTAHIRLGRDVRPMMHDPQTLATNLEQWRTTIADQFLGIVLKANDDGSAHTEYPREAAEMLALLLNYWLVAYPTDPAGLRHRVECMAAMLDSIGVPLFDRKLIDVVVQAFTALLGLADA